MATTTVRDKGRGKDIFTDSQFLELFYDVTLRTNLPISLVFKMGSWFKYLIRDVLMLDCHQKLYLVLGAVHK